jgi:hypothetical protein
MANPNWPPDPPPDPTPVTYWTTLTVVTAVPHGLSVGDVVSTSGNTLYNIGAITVAQVIDTVTFKANLITYSGVAGSGGTVTPQAPSLSRIGNVVTATTTDPHGFYPGLRVSISDITNLTVGSTISAIARVNNVVKVTTSAPHGLTAGLNVIIAGVTDTAFDGTFEISSIIDASNFTFAQVLADASSSSGTVDFAWNGTFYIATVPSSTSFTYSQTGPDAQTAGTGTVTPVGQVEAGARNCVLIFQTRSGYLTAPSPPQAFSADGGKHVLVQALAIGPANVVARICAFTGVDGDNYFYIPVPAQIGGQQVATSTVVNDNTSTSALFDFSDNTLFAATAIDVQGNNLFAQVVLGPCIGFFAYAGRLFAWGEYNKVENFLNMGFEGGYVVTNQPAGWDVVGTGGTLVTDGDVGQAWKVTQSGTDNGMITQLAYRTWAGVPIIHPNTNYSFRLWAKVLESAQVGNIIAELYDANATTLLSTATIPLGDCSTDGGFVQGDFDTVTPSSIPVGLILRVYLDNLILSKWVILDELEVVYTDAPYLDGVSRASYVNNLEAFDGVTGVIGPQTDNSQLQDMAELRDSLYMLTAAKLHQTRDLTDEEPANWTIAEMASECGALSFRSVTSGEDWFAWASPSGARIFGGGHPYKISQEIQERWNEINPLAKHMVWAKNDPVKRRIYFGLPTGTHATPDTIYPMDYRDLMTADEIASRPAIRSAVYGGSTDLGDAARKWTKWNVFANCGEILTLAGGEKEFCLGGGNGQALGVGTGYGNVYYLDPTKYTDDDYGQISSPYTTYFFVGHDKEGQLRLGSHRKLYVYLAMNVSGVGKIRVVPLVDRLGNEWRPTPYYDLSQSPDFDFEWGLNCYGERVAFRIEVVPITDPEDLNYTNGTDASYQTGKMIVTMRQNAISPVRGAL